MAVTPVEASFTQTGSVDHVASALVGAVTFLLTIFTIISFWATVFTELPAHSLGAAALAGDGVTRSSIFTVTFLAAVQTKRSFWASLVANNSGPSCSARTAVLRYGTGSAILAVVTG